MTHYSKITPEHTRARHGLDASGPEIDWRANHAADHARERWAHVHRAEEILSADELFMHKHAGYSYDPKTETKEQGRQRCARELARAERWMHETGARVVWVDDWEIRDHVKYYGDAYDREPTTCEWAELRLGGEVLASLGCIDDATDEYRRVIEAELADEARALILSDLSKL